MTKKHLLLVLALVVVLAVAGTAYYYHRRKKVGQLSTSADPTPKAPEDGQLTQLGAADGPLAGTMLGALDASQLTPVATITVADPVGATTTASSSDGSPLDVPPVYAPVVDAALSGVGAVQVATAAPNVFPLRAGSTGTEVSDLQTYLVREYGASFPAGITSQFDGATQAYVRKHLKRSNVSRELFLKIRKSLAKH